ncbi:MAG: transketolase [Gemmatimonadota bacterium]|nr:transketolase [Gemmatimonadota bacterium]MDH5198283.1 transketolase [Gemmatimonadota bacterium]
MRDAFVARLTRLAEHDPRIMLITGDLGFGVLTRFAADRPRQFLNAGVAEPNMTGLATGLALDGRIVFTYSIANFPTLRCLEQVRNDAAYHDADVKIVAIGGGFSYGALGMSHHATEDLAILRAIPSITVVSPGCLWEVEEATEAIVRTPGVCYLRLDKSSAGRTNADGETFQLGRMRVLRDGDDVSLLATGGILGTTLRAASRLADEGIGARVLSVHTIRPFDADTLFRACRETGGVVTVEEHVVDGGLGGLVAETCLEAGVVPRGFHRIGLRAGFSSIVGSQEYLRGRYGMDEDAIAAAARAVVRGDPRTGSRVGRAGS